MCGFTCNEDSKYTLNAVPINDTDNIGFDVTFIVVPEMANKIKTEYIKAQRKIIRINGFRKGKAPVGLIEKKMGGLQAVYGASFATYANTQILKNSPYKVIHTYDIDVNEKDDESWIVTLKLAVEPLADIKNEDLEMTFEVQRLNPDDYVDYRITSFARVNPYLHMKEDDKGNILPAAEDDMVEVSVEAFIDDKKFEHGSHDATDIRLVEGGVNPRSLYEKLLGSVPGDSFSIITTNPEEIPGPFKNDFKGKSKFEIRVVVNHVYRCTDPEIDDDLAITAGFNSLDEWKNSLLDSANRINKSREEQTQKSLVLDHIVSTIKYPDFPDAWAEAHARELIFRGKHPDTPFLRQELKRIAKQNTLLKQIGEFLNIEWDEEEGDISIYDRNEQAYANKVLHHLVNEKARFIYVDSKSTENSGGDRTNGTKGLEKGSTSSDRETLDKKLQSEV